MRVYKMKHTYFVAEASLLFFYIYKEKKKDDDINETMRKKMKKAVHRHVTPFCLFAHHRTSSLVCDFLFPLSEEHRWEEA